MAIPTNYVHEPRIVFFAVAFTNTEYRRTTCDIFYGFLYTIHTHSPYFFNGGTSVTGWKGYSGGTFIA
jgi:hypothetical protein